MKTWQHSLNLIARSQLEYIPEKYKVRVIKTLYMHTYQHAKLKNRQFYAMNETQSRLAVNIMDRAVQGLTVVLKQRARFALAVRKAKDRYSGL